MHLNNVASNKNNCFNAMQPQGYKYTIEKINSQHNNKFF